MIEGGSGAGRTPDPGGRGSAGRRSRGSAPTRFARIRRVARDPIVRRFRPGKSERSHVALRQAEYSPAEAAASSALRRVLRPDEAPVAAGFGPSQRLAQADRLPRRSRSVRAVGLSLSVHCRTRLHLALATSMSWTARRGRNSDHGARRDGGPETSCAASMVTIGVVSDGAWSGPSRPRVVLPLVPRTAGLEGIFVRRGRSNRDRSSVG